MRADLFGLLARAERNGLPITSALAGLASRPKASGPLLWSFATACCACLALGLAVTWVGAVAGVLVFAVFAENGFAASRLCYLGRALYVAIGRGQSLGEAMETHPDWFFPYEVGAVRAGERAGRLGPALAFLERSALARRTAALQFIRSFVYPAVLLPIAGGVALWTLIFVGPKLIAIRNEFGVPPTAPSRLLTWMAQWVSQANRPGWVLFVPVLAGVAILLLQYVRFGALAERLPWLRRPVRWGSQGRFLFALGNLLQGRVETAEAMGLAGAASGSPALAAAAQRATARVTRGEALLDALEAEACVPAHAAAQLRVVAGCAEFERRCMVVGGDLADMQSQWLARAARICEPLTTVCMTLAAAVFAWAIYLTLFSMPLLVVHDQAF